MSFIKRKIKSAACRIKNKWRDAAKLVRQSFTAPINAIDPDNNKAASGFVGVIITTIVITILSFFAMFALMKGDANAEALISVFKSQPLIYVPIFFSLMFVNYIISFSLIVMGAKRKEGRFRVFKTTLLQLPRVHICVTILYFLAAVTQQLHLMIVLMALYFIFEVFIAQIINFNETRLRITVTLAVNGVLFYLFYMYAVPFLLRL